MAINFHELELRLIDKIKVLFIALFITGCVNSSSTYKSIVYQSQIIPEKPSKVGYSQFTYEEKNEFRGKGSIEAFDTTMASIFIENQISFTKIHIPDFEELKDIQPDYIIRLCDKYNLDGIFLTELKIDAVHESQYGHDYVGTTMECLIDMQYITREGKLISHTHAGAKSSLAYGDNLKFRATPTVSSATSTALNEILKTFGINPED